MAPMPSRVTYSDSIADLATQALIAWRSGCEMDFARPRTADAWDMEKLEAIDSALECLKQERDAPGAFPTARVRAATRLLENLTYSG